jgi:hypothetical protein
LSGQYPLLLRAVTWFLTALAGKKVKVNGQCDNLLTVTVLMVSAEVCFVC